MYVLTVLLDVEKVGNTTPPSQGDSQWSVFGQMITLQACMYIECVAKASVHSMATDGGL